MKNRIVIKTESFTFNKDIAITRDESGKIIEKIAEPVEVPGATFEIESEYTAGEAVKTYELFKTASKELPEIFKQFAIEMVKAMQETERELASDETAC